MQSVEPSRDRECDPTSRAGRRYCEAVCSLDCAMVIRSVRPLVLGLPDS